MSVLGHLKHTVEQERAKDAQQYRALTRLKSAEYTHIFDKELNISICNLGGEHR